MKKSRFFDCPCYDRASFYGKAKIEERDDGKKVLYSYNTAVCGIDEKGVFYRFWDGESATTMRHINAFLRFYGIEGGGVAWWRGQPIKGSF